MNTNQLRPVPLDQDYWSIGDAHFMHEMGDESMEPTIKKFDLLVVSKNLTRPREGIFLLSGFGLCVRRVQPMVRGKILLLCDNKSHPYSRQEIDRDQWETAGQVVGLMRRFCRG